MKISARWMFSVLGYSMYTLCILVVLLWVLFPTDSLRVWLENHLAADDSSLAWKIETLERAWPLSLEATNVRAMTNEGGDILLTLDSFKIRPDLTGIGQKWPLAFQATLLGGTVTGTAAIDRANGTIQCQGNMDGIKVEGLDSVWQQLGRKGGGKLAGSFQYAGSSRRLLSGSMDAAVVMSDGFLDLLQPVFGMKSLVFSSLTADLGLKDRLVAVEKGRVESSLFAGDFSGTVTLADTLPGSGLDIAGSFEPRPEMLGSLNDPAIVELVKGQLSEDRLSFTVSDTLQQPGLTFQGTSGVIDGIFHGSDR